MPIFADLPDAQNNRLCLTLAILDYMREKGVATKNDRVLRIQDYECFYSRRTEEGYRKIRQAIFVGPICGEFSMYKGIQTHKKENGIYKGVDAKGKLHERIGLHAVSMVGYGDKAADKYFEGKNSWSDGWCDGGYAEMDPSLFGRIGIPIGVSLEVNMH
ncbi:uncharacterized protein LOC131330253 [Rhododendron vialii]|uniref:uncharacterized protein LOC131330253 n=1 Tax=Rhododendron vialii TaxID=182163 RepID=UPI00265DEE8E|nr:uncharacterized protein LOC131330253 [Rhododendron vialii]